MRRRVIIYLFQGNKERKINWCMPSQGRQEGEFFMKKFCTKCGKPFDAIGREVICPSCKAQAAEESKRAAVLKAKRASWNGESVPVRISGRASTVIREYGTANNLPFASALDALLKSTSFFQTMGKAWEEVEPYRSHRRDKHTTETENKQDTPQEVKQAAGKQEKPVKPVKQAAKKAASTSKAAGKKVVK